MCSVCGCGQAEMVLEKVAAGEAQPGAPGRRKNTPTTTTTATVADRTAIRPIIMTTTIRNIGMRTTTTMRTATSMARTRPA